MTKAYRKRRLLSGALAFVSTLCYGFLLYQWSFFVKKSTAHGIVGFMVGVAMVIAFGAVERKVISRKSAGSNLIAVLEQYNIPFVAILAIPLALLAYTFIYEFGFNYVNARWYTQAQMNVVVLRSSIAFATLIAVGAYHSLFPWRSPSVDFKSKRAWLKAFVNRFPAITLLVLIFGLPIAVARLPVQHELTKRYDWNDGPWLSWNEEPSTTATISWLSDEKTTTRIFFGVHPDELLPLEQNSNTYEFDVFGGSTRQNLHHVFLRELSPDTKYYYKIPGLSFQDNEKNRVLSFKTASREIQDFKFVVVGDMQPWSAAEGIAQDVVAEGIANENPDFVCAVGDLGDFGRNLNDWHKLMSFLPKYASQTAFQSVLGNHDYYGDQGKNFRNAFPYNYSDEEGFYYSFDYQNAHFAMLDSVSEHKGKLENRQKEWLVRDLDRANNTLKQDWLFIFLHYNLLTTAGGKGYTNLLRWLAPIAAKYGVDGIFFGHEHYYEHWEYAYGSQNLIFNSSDASFVSESGDPIHYFLTGGGGATLNVGWNILGHEAKQNDYYFYNLSRNQSQKISTTSTSWNSSRYLLNESLYTYGYNQESPLYYHAPEIQSYCPEVSDIFGYQYGEQTTHYMKVEISNGGNTCKISVCYPNGELLVGPQGQYPQIWTLNK